MPAQARDAYEASAKGRHLSSADLQAKGGAVSTVVLVSVVPLLLFTAGLVARIWYLQVRPCCHVTRTMCCARTVATASPGSSSLRWVKDALSSAWSLSRGQAGTHLPRCPSLCRCRRTTRGFSSRPRSARRGCAATANSSLRRPAARCHR